MTKILVVGCSITCGDGLENTINNPKLWVNQLGHKLFDNPEITNLAKVGRNNNWIFTETASALIANHYDIVIVGWTDTERYNYNVGLELYPTVTRLTKLPNININPNILITGSQLEKIGNQLRKISNEHWGILELVKYVNILHNIQVTTRKSKLFFVNALCHFSNNYFKYIDFSKPSELDPKIQNILQADTRDDDEVKKLYKKIHDDYTFYGGIHEEHWLNLYSSLNSMKIDVVSESDLHPGYASQDKFAKYFIEVIKEKLV